MSDITVFDGICGSGKTTRAIELIQRLTGSGYGSRLTEKFIFVTPYMMECHRIAGTIPVEIPIEHASAYQEFEVSEKSEKDNDINLEPRRDEEGRIIYRSDKPTTRHFVIPPKIDGSRLNGIKEALGQGRDIVITHSAFIRFDQELIDQIKLFSEGEFCGYHLVIDEIPQLFGELNDLLPHPLTNRDLQNLHNSGNLSVDVDNIVSWRETTEVTTWDIFSSFIQYCNEKRVVQYTSTSKPYLFIRQIPEIFKIFQSIHLLTYIFEGSIAKSYFDLYNISYSIDDMSSYTQDETNYGELIYLHRTNDSTVNSYSNTALSSSWYNRNRQNLTPLKQATSNFFVNSNRDIPSEDRLWTVYKKYKSVTEGRGYTRRFLSLSARATNSYKNVKAMAYLANLYPYTPIANFFASKNCPIDGDKYALGEMLQWIFRSQIRDGEPIKLFVPSPRMKRLLENWMEEFSDNN